jgi:RNA polymerase sigma factor (sigma-70 family)
VSLVESDRVVAPDDALVAAAQLGDNAAFEGLYRRYRSGITALCSRSLSDVHAIEDVTQETFLRAFRHIGEFDRDRPVWPWLSTIAKRLCIDELRGTTRRAVLGRSVHGSRDEVYDSTSEEALASVDRQRLGSVITGAVAALRPRDRSVFVLQTLHGRSHEEIARQHGMSVHAVRNLAWRARNALKRSLKSERLWGWGWLVPAGMRSRPRRSDRLSRTWRLRAWMNAHLESVAVDRAATIVLGLAAAGATLLGPGATPGRSVLGVTAGPLPMQKTHATVASGATPSAQMSEGARPIASRSAIVGTSISIADHHGGAAAPPAATAYIEVRSPDGRPLVWHEHDVHCGDQGARVLPRSGPVVVVC